jgi:hypothetical protein
MLFRAHRPARRVVTLTAMTHRILRKGNTFPYDQRIHHGFVKVGEINHEPGDQEVERENLEPQQKSCRARPQWSN